MRALALIVIAGCQAGDGVVAAPPATPAAPPPKLVADAAVVTPDAGLPPNTTVLAPVAMDGPYKTIAEACHHAKPCGFTDMDDQGRERSPATKTSCPALESSQFVDPNAEDPRPNGKGINMAQLSHRSKDLELRIGSQSCAAPKGIRSEHDIYFMFVKRAEGWWRSVALWQWSYNDKYANGTMLVKWNDQPGRTFAGIAAGTSEVTCNRQGYEHDTLELMVRVEPGTTTPIVYAPLIVGERTQLDPIEELAPQDCKKSRSATELTEHWSSDDDLELTGAATWNKAPFDNGVLTIWLLGDRVPSSVGHYRFTRP